MTYFKIFRFISISLTTLFALNSAEAFGQNTQAPSVNEPLVYVGTYTGNKSKGIYAFRMDANGKLAPLGLAAETTNPTFLAIHPNQKFLYAANEVGNFGGKKNCGAVSAFSIDAQSGKLTLLNQVSSQGGGPCHLSVDQTGKTLLVANYGGGSIAALPIKDDGSLADATTFIQHEGSGVNKQRQEGPHAHFITTDPANRFALTCDLGLDKVFVYRLDAAAAKLVPNDPPAVVLKAGSGPRHVAFHPNGRYAYVINEMGNTLVAFAWQADKGILTEVQSVSTLPEDFKGNSTTAEVEVHPSGKFVYGSNRGHDSIVVFAVDPATGKMTYVEHQSTQGKMPRHFTVTPNGKYLIAENQNSDTVLVFSIDPQTGRLTPTGQTLSVGGPVCVKFVTAK